MQRLPTVFLHMFFLAKQGETGKKNSGQCFPNESEATCKNSADLKEKKITQNITEHYLFINFIQFPTYNVLLVILHISSNLRSFL